MNQRWQEAVNVLNRRAGVLRAKRLVQKVVARDRGFISVNKRDFLPQRKRLFPVVRVDEETRNVLKAVVDVGAGLSARRGVHVDERVQSILPAPADHAVEQEEAFLFKADARAFVHEVLPVKGNADGIEAHLGDHADIRLRDKGIPVCRKELFCFLRARELAKRVLNQPFPIAGGRHEAPHVAFQKQPVAQRHAAQLNFVSVPVDEFLSFRVQKSCFTHRWSLLLLLIDVLCGTAPGSDVPHF